MDNQELEILNKYLRIKNFKIRQENAGHFALLEFKDGEWEIKYHKLDTLTDAFVAFTSIMSAQVKMQYKDSIVKLMDHQLLLIGLGI